jgi:phosphoglycolate phosphatase-like HAD superfamily hydrolase
MTEVVIFDLNGTLMIYREMLRASCLACSRENAVSQSL